VKEKTSRIEIVALAGKGHHFNRYYYSMGLLLARLWDRPSRRGSLSGYEVFVGGMNEMKAG
jgi:hypothetical protein